MISCQRNALHPACSTQRATDNVSATVRKPCHPTKTTPRARRLISSFTLLLDGCFAGKAYTTSVLNFLFFGRRQACQILTFSLLATAVYNHVACVLGLQSWQLLQPAYPNGAQPCPIHMSFKKRIRAQTLTNTFNFAMHKSFPPPASSAAIHEKEQRQTQVESNITQLDILPNNRVDIFQPWMCDYTDFLLVFGQHVITTSVIAFGYKKISGGDTSQFQRPSVPQTMVLPPQKQPKMHNDLSPAIHLKITFACYT